MDDASLLERLRSEAGLTKSEFARRAGTSRSAIDAYERGDRSPTIATLDRIARQFDRRLEVRLAPDSPPPARRRDDLASMARPLRIDDPDWMWRSLTGDFLANVFVPATASERTDLIARPPRLTGSDRFDSFVAAIAEFGAVRGDIAVPSWVTEDRRMGGPPMWWPVHGSLRSTRASAMAHSPAPFLRRCILVDGRDLPRIDP